ncbi:MAG: SDR family oxidoreductase [Nitriliruptoraceae bacterium]
MRVLVLGATGYVGGRLVPELLDAGHAVRCLARNPAKLDGRAWRPRVEVVAGDVDDAASIRAACVGMDAVVFLIHAMDGRGDFERREQRFAVNVRDAAAAEHVGRIVYLGGLGDDSAELSAHLRSRQATGRILAAGPVPVTELRAGVVIGSGSASFEMLRNLVEVLPAMVTPKWVNTRTQPIAIGDVLRYLVGVLSTPETTGRIFEIGGPDIVTYRQMMDRYADAAGLRRRLIIPVPVLSPRLSSLWVGLVTPLPAGVARPLVGSLVNEVVVRDDAIRALIPFAPTPFDDALRLALRRVRDLEVSSTWASAGGAGSASPDPQDPDWAGGTVRNDVRTVVSRATPEAVFAVIRSIGGARGYFSSRLLWGIRGAIDTLVGGIGLRRGRRHPTQLAVGDAVDFWRVETLDEPVLLRLRAEFKLPGDAWLEFRIRPHPDGAELEQRARFHPRGLWGRVYWLAVTPFHGVIFATMARRIAREAEATPSVPTEDRTPTHRRRRRQ